MNLKPLNILLADDDMDDCNFFIKALEELPLATNLAIVHDGEELMKRLTNQVKEVDRGDKETNNTPLPDVLFLNINMPRKNGLECLYEMKQHEKLKDVPVVIFSTSNSRDKISTLFQTGAHIYIHKTGDFSQLKEVIHHALPIAIEKAASNSQVKYILNA